MDYLVILRYREAIKNVPIEVKVTSIREDSNYTPLNEISTDFTDSIVAIEDRRFYEHGAVDIIALARATFINLKEKQVLQGEHINSAGCQKYIVCNDQNFVRKVGELFVAYNLEKIYSKDEILELYVNVIYYGDGNYGIKEASENYFGKLPSELSYVEATLLAGLPQAPRRAYALSTNYERAKLVRQAEVIEALTEYRE